MNYMIGGNGKGNFDILMIPMKYYLCSVRVRGLGRMLRRVGKTITSNPEKGGEHIVEPAIGVTFDSLGRRTTSTTCTPGSMVSVCGIARVD
jgi:hypothetical protein